MKTPNIGLGVCIWLALFHPSDAQEKKASQNYGWKVGQLMPFHVVDFAAGLRNDGCGCPSKMVSNAKGRGIMIWSKTGDPQGYELAAALDGRLSGDERTQGFFVNFAGLSLDALRKEAGTQPLKNFQVSLPRESTRLHFAKADATGKAGTLVFFVDNKEIKALWATEAGQLNEERIRTIVEEAEKFLPRPE